MRPLVPLALTLALLPFAALSVTAGEVCDAQGGLTASAAAPCLVDGQPVPQEDVKCLAASPRASCLYDPTDAGDNAGLAVDTGRRRVDPEDDLTHPEHVCPAVAHIHGAKKNEGAPDEYYHAAPGAVWAEFHHCAHDEPWGQSLAQFEAHPGLLRSYRGHDQVTIGWGDSKFHDTCVGFWLPNGGTVRTCALLYN